MNSGGVMDEKKVKTFKNMQGRFFSFSAHLQNSCESESIKNNDSLGDGIPQTFKNLDECLQNVDAIASCFWGCAGGNHIIEHLLGRVGSFSLAALRLINMGHYDEAFSLIRTNGEIANLLALFSLNIEEANEWYILDDKNRQKKFSPLAVRRKIELHGTQPPMDKDSYKELSAFGTHANPKTPPQIHNLGKVPVSGGRYQEIGYVKCINHLSVVAGYSCAYAVEILKTQSRLDKEIASYSSVKALVLLAQVGELSLTADESVDYEEVHFSSLKIFANVAEYKNITNSD